MSKIINVGGQTPTLPSGLWREMSMPTVTARPGQVILSSDLPKEIDMQKLEKLLATLPLREDSNSELSAPKIQEIRLNGTLRFKYDGLDETRREIVNMLKQDAVICFFEKLFDARRYPADCQGHVMPTGSELKEHIHNANNIFIIFHFSKNYEGGRYFERISDKIVYPQIPAYSACINYNAVAHGVEKVSSGVRNVLVTSWDRSKLKS